MFFLIMEFVNYTYLNNNTLSFIDIDGNISQYKISQLGFPYFLGVPDETKKFTSEELGMIHHVEKLRIRYMTHEGIKEVSGYKVFTYIPKQIPIIRAKFKQTFEAKIPYIRRLTFDGVLNWTGQIPHYADIDIEERNGQIEVIGYKDSVTNDYIALHSVEELITIIKQRKITVLYAWNGAGYDFGRLDTMINDKYYHHVLKLDAMLMYSVFHQKPLRSLNQAGQETGMGQKIAITKPFSQLTQEELERYNKQDVELQGNILDSLGIRQLIHNYTNMLALHPHEFYSQTRGDDGNLHVRPSAVRAFDSMAIRENTERLYLSDTYEKGKISDVEGGYVHEPQAGLYYNVVSLDYKSLYPSLILFKDYDSYIYKLIQKFERYYYDLRQDYKKKYKETGISEYNTTQESLKILINSIYGVFLNPYFRYFNANIGAFITYGGQIMIKKLITMLEEWNYNIVYGDTDSVFISDLPYDKVINLVEEINKELSPFVVEFEKFFVKAIFF